MHFSTLASAAITAIPLVAADFHYGKSSWGVTTATGVYWEILPASQTTCLAAYHFKPIAAFGYTAPATNLTVEICNSTITLDPISGAWYTGSASLPTESGVCDKTNNGTGTTTDWCQTAAFESASAYTDLLSCSTTVCDGY